MVEVRTCAHQDCRKPFEVQTYLRSKYCSYRCRAAATVVSITRQRTPSPAQLEILIESKMAAFQKEAQHQIMERRGRREAKRAEIAARLAAQPRGPRHIVINRHVLGSVAYAVLYGDVAIGH